MSLQIFWDPAGPDRRLDQAPIEDDQAAHLHPGLATGTAGALQRRRTDICDCPAPDTLPCPPQRTAEPAAVPTRLKAMDDGLQEGLINRGYAITDAAMRAFVDPGLPAPDGFPYGSGV